MPAQAWAQTPSRVPRGWQWAGHANTITEVFSAAGTSNNTSTPVTYNCGARVKSHHNGTETNRWLDA